MILTVLTIPNGIQVDRFSNASDAGVFLSKRMKDFQYLCQAPDDMVMSAKEVLAYIRKCPKKLTFSDLFKKGETK